jgi:nucleoid-associated protein YgaU
LGDRVTESYPPYEPEETYEWDYDDRPRGGSKVLWGRVLALAIGLFLAFLIGRMTAPKGGVPESRLAALREDVQDLQDENEELQSMLEEPTPAASPTPTEEAAPQDAADGEGQELEGKTYVVERGDTLRGIAQTYCGDPSYDDAIAEYNGIRDPTELSVGSEIVIPPDCGE